MMKPVFNILSLLLFLSQNLLAQGNYDLVRIWSDDTQATIAEVLSLGVDPEGLNIRNNVYIDVIVDQNEKVEIIDLGLESEDLILDLSSFYETRLTQSAERELGYGSMGGYLTFNEIVESMDSLHSRYPDIVSQKDSIGSSYEGRTIWAFKISDNPNIDEEEPEVFYNSLIHAREPAAMMTLMHFAWELAEKYNVDPILSYLVNQREMWFVPVINPDGYVYNEWTNPGGGGLHRKNRRPGCSSSPGIDLNRNWGFQWGYDNIGSSPDSCSNTYRGSSPFSEPETQAVRSFVQAHDFKTVFNYHSYGDLLIRPFGYDASIDLPEPDAGIYQELGPDLVTENHYLYGTGDETVGYTVNGDAVDYMYGGLGIINFTPEVGAWEEGGFWPPTEKIFELAEENISMNTHLAGVSGSWIRLESFALLLNGPLENGNTLSCELLVRNKGLGSESSMVTLSLSSPDSSLLISNTSYDLSSLLPQMEVDLGGDGLNFTVNTPAGSQAQLVIRINTGDQYTLADTFFWSIGIPDTLFLDNLEMGFDQWSSNDWNVTSDSFGGSLAMTDSPNGDYPALSTLEVFLVNSIDLRGYSNPVLSFDAQWDIELNYDFCQVLASADGGSSWTALRGIYTVAGNGATVQPEGEPGYHGSRSWVHEIISLNQFLDSPALRLGFRLLSDTWYEGDGFVVDNLAVHAWGIGFHLGDITRDGLVDVADAVLLLEWIIQNENPLGDNLELADLNQDSEVDIRDLVLLIEMILSDIGNG